MFGLRRISILAVLAALASATVPAQTNRPNIVVLFADDQRADTIHAWGNEHIQTPNIDSLVEGGFSFRSNYCLGGNSGAVCVPSRAMLNSGKSYHRIAMDLDGELTLGEQLGKAGYATFGTGKWHNQRPAWLRSFQHGKTVMFGGMSDHTNVPIESLGDDGKLFSDDNRRMFSSEMFADSAIEFINGQDGEKPFYAYVAFTSPHDPRQPPMRYREMYYKNRPPLPPNFLPQHPFNNGHMSGRDEMLGAWPRTEEVVGDQLAEYYGMVTHLDEQIGRILQALEHNGIRDNTLIVYAADHGLAVGSHGLLGKQNVYEHSMGAPLIFNGPGVPKGGSTESFSYLLDIFPTLINTAGAEMPADVDGRDLRPVWEGKKEKARDVIFLSFRDVMRAINDGRWKLIRYPHINYTQLFDLQNDPYEMKNLAEDPSQAGRVKELTALLAEWQKKMGDSAPLSSEHPEPKEIDMTNQRRVPDVWQPQWIIEKYFGDWL